MAKVAKLPTVRKEPKLDPSLESIELLHSKLEDKLDEVRTLLNSKALNAAGLDVEAQVIARAIEVIENKERALRWMGTPVRGLGLATPVSLLGTAKGRSLVLKILDQLEHGVW